MNTLIAKWPAIRQATYGVLSAVLAVAGGFGLVTADQTDQLLAATASILGAASLIVAGLHVDRGPKPAPLSEDGLAHVITTAVKAAQPAPTMQPPAIHTVNVDPGLDLYQLEDRIRQKMTAQFPRATVAVNLGAAAVDAARRELEQQLGR
ncbi:hypothetical protein G4X40_20115 [Rhodococcus sp. D2-41]|uniref:hypothetical protein n=1 Tax=Speluncibacter jeojiensis TaxID=2710754 RepID=UPI00240ED3C8|nr:hypothetical protein [Rhodococcus sp. D2-41]MDG3012449.1 hypothetical protein [Rhodococcus sp. D2-41]